jgi:Transposase IS4
MCVHCLFGLSILTIYFSNRARADGSFSHGCKVLLELVRRWANTDRVVVADSYFASVQTALRLKEIGLRFIGTVKTAHKGFPLQYLSRLELGNGKGDFRAVTHEDDESGTTLMAITWIDRDRKFFVSTCSSAAPGKEIRRYRWRQVDKSPNAEPERMEIKIPQPLVVQTYYDSCQMIDRHNRQRQDSLDIEKKVQTVRWEKRVNLGLFGMMVVDAYHLYAGIREGFTCLDSRGYFTSLAEQLIDNDYDRMTLRRRREEDHALEKAIEEQGGILEPSKQRTAPTPTKRMKRMHPTHRLQGNCMVCKKNTVHVCRECQQFSADGKKQYWICNKPGKQCMGVHILDLHPKLAGR